MNHREIRRGLVVFYFVRTQFQKLDDDSDSPSLFVVNPVSCVVLRRKKEQDGAHYCNTIIIIKYQRMVNKDLKKIF